MTSTDAARQAAGLPAQKAETRPSTELEIRQRSAIGTVQRMLPRFAAALRDQALGEQFVADAITAIRTTPDLANCTEISFLGSLMWAAQLQLRPNVGPLGHCWVLPFKNKKRNITEAQFILGYRGMVTLAARSGVAMIARTVYSNEVYEVRYGLDEALHHVPNLDREARGEPIAYYAIARSSTGGVAWRIMSREETLSYRERSPGWRGGSPDNPWRTDEEAMCWKTLIRRTFPWVATDSPELANVLASDERTLTYDASTDKVTFGDEPEIVLTRADEPETTETKAEADEPAQEEPPPAKGASGRRRRRPTAEVPLPDRIAHPMNEIRRGLLARLREAHPDTWKLALAIATDGGTEEFDLATDDELVAALAVTTDQAAELALARADEKEGV